MGNMCSSCHFRIRNYEGVGGHIRKYLIFLFFCVAMIKKTEPLRSDLKVA